jgi:hypothetical protein
MDVRMQPDDALRRQLEKQLKVRFGIFARYGRTDQAH